MSLDYEFAPIDVDIISHPKAFKAGVNAMGLWLWGQAHAKLHRTGGRLSRAAVLGAWGGKRNIMLAKQLVLAGLWLAREDGDWDIYNFAKKGPGERKSSASSSAVRMARKRERDAGCDASLTAVTPSQSDASQVTVTSTSYSHSSGSDLVSQIASPPDWWGVVCDQVDQNHGVTLNRGGAWLGYWGHRADKGRGVNQADAVSWLTRVDVPAMRKEREDRAHREKRDKDFDAKRRFAKEGPEKPPAPTTAQAEAFAEELAARVRASRAGGIR